MNKKRTKVAILLTLVIVVLIYVLSRIDCDRPEYKNFNRLTTPEICWNWWPMGISVW